MRLSEVRSGKWLGCRGGKRARGHPPLSTGQHWRVTRTGSVRCYKGRCRARVTVVIRNDGRRFTVRCCGFSCSSSCPIIPTLYECVLPFSSLRVCIYLSNLTNLCLSGGAVACAGGHTECAQLLLGSGVCDISLRNADGLTGWELAAQCQQPAVLALRENVASSR